MNNLSMVLVAGSALLLQGCATSIEAFHNRPVVEDGLDGGATTVSLSADRRTVIVVPRENGLVKFCAEAPPDTAKEISAQLKAALEAEAKSEKAQAEGKVSGTLEDKLDTKVITIGNRTEAVEVFRTGVYALCQYHLNGALDGIQLKDSFDNLVNVLFVPQSK